MKPPFIIYAYFESNLVPEDKQIVACSYGYKLVCADDTFSKPFKSYLGKDSVYNFINSTIEEGKYCNDVIKKHFNKKLIMGTILNVGSVIMLILMVMLK